MLAEIIASFLHFKRKRFEHTLKKDVVLTPKPGLIKSNHDWEAENAHRMGSRVYQENNRARLDLCEKRHSAYIWYCQTIKRSWHSCWKSFLASIGILRRVSFINRELIRSRSAHCSLKPNHQRDFLSYIPYFNDPNHAYAQCSSKMFLLIHHSKALLSHTCKTEDRAFSCNYNRLVWQKWFICKRLPLQISGTCSTPNISHNFTDVVCSIRCFFRPKRELSKRVEASWYLSNTVTKMVLGNFSYRWTDCGIRAVSIF